MSHIHMWVASALHLGFLQNHCRCGAKRFLGGYDRERCNAIAERLNDSWRVR
jgi:hypothetical protein